MQKIKKKLNRKQEETYDKSIEVQKTTLFLKELMNRQQYEMFCKLGEAKGTHIEEMNLIIRDAQIVKDIKDKNKKAKYKAILQQKIFNYLDYISNHIVTQTPIINFIRLFIINGLLCHYGHVENTFYDKCKEIGLENDFKKMFNIFNKKATNFIDYEFSLPEEIRHKIIETNKHLSSCMAKTIKYNQSLFNTSKTLDIINNIDKKIYYEYQNKYLTEEGIMHSPQDSNLMSFIIYHFKQIKIDANLYASEITEEVLKDISVLEMNMGRINKCIKSICKLINEG